MITAPDKQYVFHSTNNDRVNEVIREAMQSKYELSSKCPPLTYPSLPAQGDREAPVASWTQLHPSPQVRHGQAQQPACPHLGSLTRGPQDAQACHRARQRRYPRPRYPRIPPAATRAWYQRRLGHQLREGTHQALSHRQHCRAGRRDIQGWF
jgi:hypothetical protein